MQWSGSRLLMQYVSCDTCMHTRFFFMCSLKQQQRINTVECRKYVTSGSVKILWDQGSNSRKTLKWNFDLSLVNYIAHIGDLICEKGDHECTFSSNLNDVIAKKFDFKYFWNFRLRFYWQAMEVNINSQTVYVSYGPKRLILIGVI